MTLASSIGIAILLLVEHKRLIRPSSFISLYLLCRVAADSVQLRTLVLRGYVKAITGVLSAEIAVQVVFLLLESWPKQRIDSDSTKYSPEDTAGIFNRNALWWLSDIFWLGNKRVLNQSDLYNLDVSIQSDLLRKQGLPIWEKSQYFTFCLAIHLAYTYRQIEKTRAYCNMGIFALHSMAIYYPTQSLHHRSPVFSNIFAE